jgi:SARP family transcriptional regulator, regulator of embCAB operon
MGPHELDEIGCYLQSVVFDDMPARLGQEFVVGLALERGAATGHDLAASQGLHCQLLSGLPGASVVDLRHRQDLFLAERQVVRFPGMLLNVRDQGLFVLGTDLDPAGTSHDFAHRGFLSIGVRFTDRIIEPPTCGDLAVALQFFVYRGRLKFRRTSPLVPPLRIYVCGRLAVEQEDLVLGEAGFPARQGRRLWAYLVLHRRWPVGRDDLAGAVWGDAIPDAWDVALNTLISRLRSFLRPISERVPEVSIRGEVGRYTLTLPARVFVDAERARTGLHAAETALRRRDWDMALGEARVAMEIAARGFLGGEEAPWIEGQRRALADLRLHALECTVEAELLRGNAAIAEREAEHLLLLDPMRESGYRLLMRALEAGGNAAQVIRVMDDCRRRLREQGGVEPSRETERLFQTIIGST